MAQESTPSLNMPLLYAVPNFATFSFLSPKALNPMIGLLGLLLMSMSGAKLMCIPSRLHCFAKAEPYLNTNESLGKAPKVMA